MKTVRSGRELSKALKVASKRTGKDYGFVLDKLTVDAFRELVDRSARDTGFLRSNWDVTTGIPPEEPLTGDKKGTYQGAEPPSRSYDAGDRIIIYNNTKYAMYLETGTARMRAQPMVEPTYQSIIREANRVMKALSKEIYRDV